MNYRKDIDGLRAVSVLCVIFYHLGISIFSGGYVGVDVFFVISGYLITHIVYTEVKLKKFSFRKFYVRRISRLLPALIVVIFFTLIFGFIFYTNQEFDSLGKEVFFSAFGFVNILYAQGVDYFASNTEVKPLLHLWSLGVEEQFYLFWPLILIIIGSFNKFLFFMVILVLFVFSFVISSFAAIDDKMAAYYLTQYRAFELMVGAILAIILQEKKNIQQLSSKYSEALSITGILLILVPVFTFNSSTIFPGYNALIPCLGAALLIFSLPHSFINRILSHRVFVFIGLISYPLYLVHQPIISYVKFFNLDLNQVTSNLLIISLSIFLAWLIFRYIELPFRKNIRAGNNIRIKLSLVTSMLFLLGIVGVWIAKEGGLSWRFKVLNPFSYTISKSLEPSFHNNFPRGENLKNQNAKILMLGDSVLQQYVFPITKSLNLQVENVDTVTRGGCILLKGVSFEDKIADISCDELRAKLYNSAKKYDVIFISQHWASYDSQINNSVLRSNSENYTKRKWTYFLEETVKHFTPLSKKIVIIGNHMEVAGTSVLKPSLTLTKKRFEDHLYNLKVENIKELGIPFFTKNYFGRNVELIEPYGIWCDFKATECVTNNGEFSFFSDAHHAASISNDFLIEKLKSFELINDLNQR